MGTYQKRKFSKITISSVLLCHTEPTYQKIMFLSPKLQLLALKGPLKAPFKGPLNSSKSKIFKRNIFPLHSFVTLSQHTKRLCLYTHNYVFWLLGPFLKIKGPLKGTEMQIFKNH